MPCYVLCMEGVEGDKRIISTKWNFLYGMHVFAYCMCDVNVIVYSFILLISNGADSSLPINKMNFNYVWMRTISEKKIFSSPYTMVLKYSTGKKFKSIQLIDK